MNQAIKKGLKKKKNEIQTKMNKKIKEKQKTERPGKYTKKERKKEKNYFSTAAFINTHERLKQRYHLTFFIFISLAIKSMKILQRARL